MNDIHRYLLAALIVLLQISVGCSADPRPPYTAQGIMVGEVTENGAHAQVRLTKTPNLVDGDVFGADGIVEFVVHRVDERDVPSGENPVVIRVTAESKRDYIARATFDGLAANTSYVCSTRIGSDAENLEAGPSSRFRTLAGDTNSVDVQFVVVTGMNYAKFHGDRRIDQQRHIIENNTPVPPAYAGKDKRLGYPALKSILSMKPDFFIGTGDNVYYDTPKDPRAKTADEMRQKWREQFAQQRFVDLFAAVPTYWEIDDHDYRVDDCDNTGDYAPTPQLGRRIMLEQLPMAAADDSQPKTYRTHRVSRELQIWLPENRHYRSANSTPDGVEKTIWGVEQREWLKETLTASDATFKLLISPTPMVGPDDLRKTDNHTNHGGFRHERDEFFSWLHETGIDSQHFYVVCGDRHWQYHAVHPTGIEEFSCGAMVDANARLGRKPGDPKSTDPGGLIKQPYYQTPASGGFLMIRVSVAKGDQPARLTFTYFDEHGERLYQAVKIAAASESL